MLEVATMDFTKNCRFCLNFLDDSKTIQITDAIRNNFKEFTNLDLTNSEEFPDICCENCHLDLERCISIKTRFLQSQEILERNLENYIKEEIDFSQPICESENHDVFEEEYLDPEPIKTTKRKKKIKKSEQLECQICNKSFGSSYLLNRHLKSHKNSERAYPIIPCPICGKTVRRDSLKRHQERVHEKLKNYECDLCGRQFYFKTRIVDHLKTHLKIKDISCEQCTMKFSSKGTLRAHINIIHLGRYVRNCELCGKCYPNKSYFDTHMRSCHTLERAFTCDYPNCEKSYFSKPDLSKHQKEVHIYQPEVCPVCLKTVKNLNRHKRYHEERKFICQFVDVGQICGKKFVSNFMMKKHVDIKHRGIR